MKWSIITAPVGVTWPTCDAPVVIAAIDRERHLFVSDGFGNRDRVIIFPISPSKVLWGAHKRDNRWRFVADRDLAEQIKRVIVNNALMYVYSCCDDPEITAMRGRIVDKAGFQQFQNQYIRWYDVYKKDEAPLLSREKRIKHTMGQGIDTWS